jgi:hypothetical protein
MKDTEKKEKPTKKKVTKKVRKNKSGAGNPSWRKGQPSANPKGRPKAPEEVRLAKKLSKEFVRVKLTEMLHKTVDELKAIMQDGSMQSIDVWLSRIIVMGITTGDHHRLNFMFDRIIGKVTEIKEIQISKPFMIESLDGSRTITLGTDEVSDATEKEIIGE